MRSSVTAALVLTMLTGCGPSLGNYEVTRVELVEDLPETYDHARLPEPYLQIEVRSDFDLVAQGNGNIYAYKIGCGFFDDDEHIIFGPLAAGSPPVDLYDAQPAMPRDPSGFAHYYLYVPVSSPPQQGYSNGPIEPGYDLETDQGDLCLKIIQAGYFLTASRSHTIRIPASQIADTIGRVPAS